jgi:hypothetical protein
VASGVAVSSHVIARDEFGRFIRDIEEAATKSVEEALDVGIAAARAQAPVRTGRLRGSFVPVILSRTSGLFMNTAPYAMAQDQGARPHPIPAHVRFWWDKVGRMWMYPETYERVTGFPGADPIHHPGNPATHFMDAGYVAIKRAINGILQRNYPG